MKINLQSIALAVGILAAPAHAETDSARFYTHFAARGDTLQKIANRYLVKRADWGTLQRLNTIRDPDQIPVGTRIRIPVSAMRTEPATAKVVSIGGKVESNRLGLAAGSELKEGDTLTTSDNSFVTLKLADGSTLVVQSKSAVKLDVSRQLANTGGVSDSVIRLASGRIETQVVAQKGPASRYEVRTPTSNMGVRGTVFRVAADDTGSKGQSEVLDGLVAVSSVLPVTGSAVALGAGFGTIIERGKAPQPPTRLLPAPTLNQPEVAISQPAANFSWAPVKGAAGFRVQVATDAGFTNLLTDNRTDEATTRVANFPDGMLHLRVRGIDAQGLEGNDVVHRFSVSARPVPPLLYMPGDGAEITTVRPKFAWRPAADAVAYRLQFADGKDFAANKLQQEPITATELALDKPLPSGRHTWRVASVDRGGKVGPWSDTWHFTVRSEGPSLAAVRGKNGVVLQLDVQDGRQHQVQVSRTDRFTSIVHDTLVSESEVDLGGLAQNVYYVRIRSVAKGKDANTSEFGPWSKTGMLEVYADDWWLSTNHVPAR